MHAQFGALVRRHSMKMGRLAPLGGWLIAVLLLSGSASMAGAQAHDDHSSASAMQHRKPGPQDGALVKAVREATEQYRNVSKAMQDGYGLLFGCVSGGDYGAMGLHFVNGSRVFDNGELDVTRPEIVIYEPLPNGRVRITGADYLLIAADWDAKHSGPPELMGQLFHLFESPNRFGLPAFYTLHVWAWKDNPNGTFTNWNPAVSCDAFTPQTPPMDH
jgi:hypothetical protein